MKKCIAAIAFGIAVAAPSAPAQAQLTAHEALLKVKERYGEEPVRAIVELVGYKGDSQPVVWKMVFYDPGNEYKLRTFRIRESGIRDDGPDTEFYPGKVPAGFIKMKDVRIGSRDAIKRADAAAKKAKIGFAKVDYVLRAKELTSDPIWILKLRKADNRVAGTVFISGKTGAVLRNNFVYHDAKTRSGEPRFADSALRDLKNRIEEEQAKPNPELKPSEPAGEEEIPSVRPVSPIDLTDTPAVVEPVAPAARTIESKEGGERSSDQ